MRSTVFLTLEEGCPGLLESQLGVFVFLAAAEFGWRIGIQLRLGEGRLYSRSLDVGFFSVGTGLFSEAVEGSARPPGPGFDRIPGWLRKGKGRTPQWGLPA